MPCAETWKVVAIFVSRLFFEHWIGCLEMARILTRPGLATRFPHVALQNACLYAVKGSIVIGYLVCKGLRAFTGCKDGDRRRGDGESGRVQPGFWRRSGPVEGRLEGRWAGGRHRTKAGAPAFGSGRGRLVYSPSNRVHCEAEVARTRAIPLDREVSRSMVGSLRIAWRAV